MTKAECHMTWKITTTSPVRLHAALRELDCVIDAEWTKGSWVDVEPSPRPRDTSDWDKGRAAGEALIKAKRKKAKGLNLFWWRSE